MDNKINVDATWCHASEVNQCRLCQKPPEVHHCLCQSCPRFVGELLFAPLDVRYIYVARVVAMTSRSGMFCAGTLRVLYACFPPVNILNESQLGITDLCNHPDDVRGTTGL